MRERSILTRSALGIGLAAGTVAASLSPESAAASPQEQAPSYFGCPPYETNPYNPFANEINAQIYSDCVLPHAFRRARRLERALEREAIRSTYRPPTVIVIETGQPWTGPRPHHHNR
jgi:hypothetical protein